MNRTETREALEDARDDARRALHYAAVFYTADGAGTKTQADLEAVALAFAAAVNALRAVDGV
jgi:hypothetical protein